MLACQNERSHLREERARLQERDIAHRNQIQTLQADRQMEEDKKMAARQMEEDKKMAARQAKLLACGSESSNFDDSETSD